MKIKKDYSFCFPYFNFCPTVKKVTTSLGMYLSPVLGECYYVSILLKVFIRSAKRFQN